MESNKLVPCPVCGHDCSPRAECCPHCGEPFESEKKLLEKKKDFVQTLILLIAAIALITLFALVFL